MISPAAEISCRKSHSAVVPELSGELRKELANRHGRVTGQVVEQADHPRMELHGVCLTIVNIETHLVGNIRPVA